MQQLILGGARSGKSKFAEKQAKILLKMSGKTQLYYLATSVIFDQEMQDRVDQHKARRGPEWVAIEESLKLDQEILKLKKDETMLIDCLTLWLNNIIYQKLDVDTEIDKLIIALKKTSANVIMVSNEIGMGLVPEHKLSREFRDHQGLLNQKIAEQVDKVAFVAAGLPLWMK